MMLCMNWDMIFRAAPGFFSVDRVRDGTVFEWSGGPVTFIPECVIETVLLWIADGALPWDLQPGPYSTERHGRYFVRVDMMEAP